MATFICHGQPTDIDRLFKWISDGTGFWWTIDRRAKRGARVIFYLRNHVSAFVAEGKLVSGELIDGATRSWPGKKKVKVRLTRVAEHPLGMRNALELYSYLSLL